MTPTRKSSFVAAALVAVSLSTRVQGQGIDYAKIEILTEKIAPNLYMLSGSAGAADPGHQDGAGGRIGVLAGPDGIFMVDSQYGQITDKVVAAIRKISSEPIIGKQAVGQKPACGKSSERRRSLGAITLTGAAKPGPKPCAFGRRIYPWRRVETM